MSQWLRWAKNQVNLTNQTTFAKNQGPTRKSLASHLFNKEILELPLVIQHEPKHSLILYIPDSGYDSPLFVPMWFIL